MIKKLFVFLIMIVLACRVDAVTTNGVFTANGKLLWFSGSLASPIFLNQYVTNNSSPTFGTITTTNIILNGVSKTNWGIGGDIFAASNNVFTGTTNTFTGALSVTNDGRSVWGAGLILDNIDISAYGASQKGNLNSGVMTIGQYSYGASQNGSVYGGLMSIGADSEGSYQGVRINSVNGLASIGINSAGAGQYGYVNGSNVIGNTAYGAVQRGRNSSGYATNNAVGAVQVFDLTMNQLALTTAGGAGSILLGAGTASNKYSIVAGDGQQSYGDGSIVAGGGFWDNGIRITNSSFAQTTQVYVAQAGTAQVALVYAETDPIWVAASNNVVYTNQLVGLTNDATDGDSIVASVVGGITNFYFKNATNGLASTNYVDNATNSVLIIANAFTTNAITNISLIAVGTSNVVAGLPTNNWNTAFLTANWSSNSVVATSNQLSNLPTNLWNTVVIVSNNATYGSNTAYAVSNMLVNLPTNDWSAGTNIAVGTSNTVAGFDTNKWNNAITNGGNASLSITIPDATLSNQPITLAQQQASLASTFIAYFNTNKLTTAPFTNGFVVTNAVYGSLLTSTDTFSSITFSTSGKAVGDYIGGFTVTNRTFTKLSRNIADIEEYWHENSGGSASVVSEFWLLDTVRSQQVAFGTNNLGAVVTAGTTPTLNNYSVNYGELATNNPMMLVIRHRLTALAGNPNLIMSVQGAYASHIAIDAPVSQLTTEFVKTDGSRAMTGTLDLGNNGITNISLLNVAGNAQIDGVLSNATLHLDFLYGTNSPSTRTNKITGSIMFTNFAAAKSYAYTPSNNVFTGTTNTFTNDVVVSGTIFATNLTVNGVISNAGYLVASTLTSNTTYIFYPTQTINQINTIINTIPRYMNNKVLNLLFDTGTYTNDTATSLTIASFCGGSALQVGWTNFGGFASVNTNQNVVINYRANTSARAVYFSGNSTPIFCNGIKVMGNSTNGGICIGSSDNTRLYIRYCALLGNGTANGYGVNQIAGTTIFAQSIVGDVAASFFGAGQGILSLCLPTNSMPLTGCQWFQGTCYRNDTNVLGVTDNAVSQGGLIIKAAGTIIP